KLARGDDSALQNLAAAEQLHANGLAQPAALKRFYRQPQIGIFRVNVQFSGSIDVNKDRRRCDREIREVQRRGSGPSWECRQTSRDELGGSNKRDKRRSRS